MVNENEDLTVPPPPQLRDGYKPVPAPRTPKIKKLDQVLKGHVASFEVGIEYGEDPLGHSMEMRKAVESHLKGLLEITRGFKFGEMLKVTFEKVTHDSDTGNYIKIHKTAYFNSKAKAITNSNKIGPELSTSRQEIIRTIKSWLSEGLRWVIDGVKMTNVFIGVTLGT